MFKLLTVLKPKSTLFNVFNDFVESDSRYSSGSEFVIKCFVNKCFPKI